MNEKLEETKILADKILTEFRKSKFTKNFNYSYNFKTFLTIHIKRLRTCRRHY